MKIKFTRLLSFILGILFATEAIYWLTFVVDDFKADTIMWKTITGDIFLLSCYVLFAYDLLTKDLIGKMLAWCKNIVG